MHARFRAAAGEDWAEGLPRDSSIEVDVTVTHTGSAFLVEGTVNGSFLLRCDRCLLTFDWPLSARLTETYLKAAEPGGGDDEPVGDDFVFEAESVEEIDDAVRYAVGDTVDISEAVRELALVSLPMKAVCDEGCRGLCPNCGVNLNHNACACEREDIDPRLADLADFLKFMGSGS